MAENGSPASLAGDDRAGLLCSAASDPTSRPPADLNQSPSPAAISVARDLSFESIIDAASLAESYARSACEAAWRGDLLTVEVSLRQLRLCVMAAIASFKSIDADGEFRRPA
jgi:hypothetical protein